MAINNATIRADIFKELRAVIKNNISSTVKVTNAFVDDIAQFPQVIIHSPIVPRERQSMGTESKSYNRNGSIDIEVYAKDTKSAILLHDEVEEILFNNQNSISLQNISIGDSSMVNIDVGGKIVRGFVIPLNFMYSR